MSARTSKRITRSSCVKLENAKQSSVGEKKRKTTDSNISKYQLMTEEQRRKKIEYQKDYNRRKYSKEDQKEYNKKYYQEHKKQLQLKEELCVCGSSVVNMKSHLLTKLHANKLNNIICILIDLKDAKQ